MTADLDELTKQLAQFKDTGLNGAALDAITALRAEAALAAAMEGTVRVKPLVRQARGKSYFALATHPQIGVAIAKLIRDAEIRGQIKAGGVFATSGAEERYCEAQENACPACGGSGHKDDAAEALLAMNRAAKAPLIEALEWYGENARLAKLIHTEGDVGRHAIAQDGGERARAAIAAAEKESKP